MGALAPVNEVSSMQVRSVVVVCYESGKWVVQHRISDREAERFPPITGAKDVNALADWIAEGWRIVSGSGYESKDPGFSPATMMADAKGHPRPRGPDRLVLTLEHE
jgi:hypothetical protein